jgi:hypothetical protein
LLQIYNLTSLHSRSKTCRLDPSTIGASTSPSSPCSCLPTSHHILLSASFLQDGRFCLLEFSASRWECPSATQSTTPGPTARASGIVARVSLLLIVPVFGCRNQCCHLVHSRLTHPLLQVLHRWLRSHDSGVSGLHLLCLPAAGCRRRRAAGRALSAATSGCAEKRCVACRSTVFFESIYEDSKPATCTPAMMYRQRHM